MVIPASVEELREVVRGASEPIRVVGTGSHRFLPVASGLHEVSMVGLSGIVRFSAPDQVLVVRAGTKLADLQDELAVAGHCLPIEERFGTVGGWLASGRPHLNEGVYPPWKDLLLGATVLLADGTLAKAGSEVVKNVAGYDLHRFLVGSRGYLAVFVEIVLRVAPKSAVRFEEWPRSIGDGADVNWIGRTFPSELGDLRRALEGRCAYIDSKSATGFAALEEAIAWKAHHGWVMAPNERVSPPRLVRSKTLFDPEGKLNPLAFGGDA